MTFDRTSLLAKYRLTSSLHPPLLRNDSVRLRMEKVGGSSFVRRSLREGVAVRRCGSMAKCVGSFDPVSLYTSVLLPPESCKGRLDEDDGGGSIVGSVPGWYRLMAEFVRIEDDLAADSRGVLPKSLCHLHEAMKVPQ